MPLNWNKELKLSISLVGCHSHSNHSSKTHMYWMDEWHNMPKTRTEREKLPFTKWFQPLLLCYAKTYSLHNIRQRAGTAQVTVTDWDWWSESKHFLRSRKKNGRMLVLIVITNPFMENTQRRWYVSVSGFDRTNLRHFWRHIFTKRVALIP